MFAILMGVVLLSLLVVGVHWTGAVVIFLVLQHALDLSSHVHLVLAFVGGWLVIYFVGVVFGDWLLNKIVNKIVSYLPLSVCNWIVRKCDKYGN